jgi:hypothetical protein
MKWLAQELGITRPEQWYAVTNQDFKDHKGAAFLSHYNSTISEAIMAYLPRHAWKPWMFSKTPKGFWDDRGNRRRYMQWLAARLGIQEPDDWSRVTGADFQRNHGNQFLKLYDGSPLEAARDCCPRHRWKEWMFARVPAGFWKSAENRQRYLDWLGRKLGYRKPSDWLKITREDFRQNYGGGLLLSYRSYLDLLREYRPDFDWQTRRNGAVH